MTRIRHSRQRRKVESTGVAIEPGVSSTSRVALARILTQIESSPPRARIRLYVLRAFVLLWHALETSDK